MEGEGGALLQAIRVLGRSNFADGGSLSWVYATIRTRLQPAFSWGTLIWAAMRFGIAGTREMTPLVLPPGWRYANADMAISGERQAAERGSPWQSQDRSRLGSDPG